MKSLARCACLPRSSRLTTSLRAGSRFSRATIRTVRSPSRSRAANAQPSPPGRCLVARQQHTLKSSVYERPTEIQQLAEELESFNETKWGWVLYRCTYGDDAAWERFKDLVTRPSRRGLQGEDVPPIVRDGVDWTFVSHRATLDGASRDALRQCFRAWVAEDAPGLAGQGPHFLSSRHTYFVQVDEASLRSVLDDDVAGWINLVRCADGLDYNLDPEYKAGQEEYRKELEMNGEEYISEDWIMLESSTLSAAFYVTLGSLPETWYTFYSQPPNLVVY